MIIAVAQCLQRDFGRGAAVIRLRGEEFGLFLWQGHEGELVADVERALASIGALSFAGGEREFGITASAGLALLSTGEGLHEALRRADLGLYAAKRGGRNRMVLAPASPTAEPGAVMAEPVDLAVRAA